MPRRNSYTPEQLTWLAERSGTTPRDELTEAFNRRFRQSRSTSAITSAIKREGLPQRPPGYPKGHHITLLTKQQDAWLRAAYQVLSLEAVTRQLNLVWQRDLRVSQVRAYLNNHGITSGRTGRFEKGHTVQRNNPVPKGPGPGRFRKGEVRGAAQHNYVPIGTLRWSKDGYLERKVTDDHPVPARRWVGEHRLIWEAENGPIPDGHVVVFLDGDPTHLELSNLRCVSRAVLARLNHWRSVRTDGGDARKAMILACELEVKANKRRKAA